MMVSPNDWAAIVGAVLPGVIAVITRRHWSSRLKAATSFGIVLVTTAVGLVVQGTVAARPATLSAGMSMFGTLMAATLVSYRAVWSPLGASAAIEQKVNGGNVPTVEVPVTAEVPADSSTVAVPADGGPPVTDPSVVADAAPVGAAATASADDAPVSEGAAEDSQTLPATATATDMPVLSTPVQASSVQASSVPATTTAPAAAASGDDGVSANPVLS